MSVRQLQRMTERGLEQHLVRMQQLAVNYANSDERDYAKAEIRAVKAELKRRQL